MSLEGPSGQIAQLCDVVISAGRYEFSVSGTAVRFRNVSGGAEIDLSGVSTSSGLPTALVLSVNEDSTDVDSLVLEPGAICDDDNACTADACDLVLGCTHTALTCDDGLSCSTDACNPAIGCVHTSNDPCCIDPQYSDDFNRTAVGPDWQTCADVSIVSGALQFFNTSGTPTNCPNPTQNLAHAKLIANNTLVRNGRVQFDLENGGLTRANNVFQISFGFIYVDMQQDNLAGRQNVWLRLPDQTILAMVNNIVITAGRYEFSVEGSLVRFRNVVGGTSIDLQTTYAGSMPAGHLEIGVNEDTVRVDNLVLTIEQSCDGCADGSREGLTGPEFHDVAACAGSWTSWIDGGYAAALCAPGWTVCRPASSSVHHAAVGAINFAQARAVAGCFPYNASQDNGTCGPCTGDGGHDDMAAIGADCAYAWATGFVSCLATGRVDADCCDAFVTNHACKQNNAEPYTGVMCCRD